jgi:hypothetical protein
MMIRKFWLLTAAMRAGPNAPFNSGDYPREARKAVGYGHEECKRQRGGRGNIRPPATVRNLDLTVDGRDDYIVDFHDTECAGRHSRCRRDREWTEEALISPTRF